jgi:hypothetical protein
MRLVCCLFLFAVASFAQETPAPGMNPAEKRFHDMLADVTLEGFYTRGEKPELQSDRYVITRVTKIKDELWRFEARVQYNKKDLPIALPLPVKFAGDTPVISLTNFAIPGFGSYTARILIYENSYAGMWGDAKRGGIMFGRIVKNPPAPSR